MSRCACGCAAELGRLRDTVAGLQRTLKEVQSLVRARPAQVATPTRAEYDEVLAELPGSVVGLVPAGARVLVVSRGDDRLLALDGCVAGHFPQAADGSYAGHHPHDSETAVAELERMRADGWRYLVFPVTALWWLDHYAGLRRHLETTGRLLLRREGLGLVYGLSLLPGPRPGPHDPDDVTGELAVPEPAAPEPAAQELSA